jgi:hypothetical protein
MIVFIINFITSLREHILVHELRSLSKFNRSYSSKKTYNLMKCFEYI